MTARSNRGPNANTAARLPALAPQTQVTDTALRQFLESVREWLEVRLGARGDFYERAVTHRELQEQLNALPAASSASTDLSGVNNDMLRMQTLLSTLTAQVQTLQNQVLVNIGGNTVIQNILNQVRDVAVEDVTVYARDMRPTQTAGCAAVATIEFASTRPNFHALAFDATTNESAEFCVVLPRSWAGKQFNVQVYWGHGSTTTNFAVNWYIQANSTSDQELLIRDFISGVTVADTGGTTGNLYIATSTSVPIASNKNADGDLVNLRISRRNGGVSGNLAIDAQLLAVRFVLADVVFEPDVVHDTTMTWNSSDKHADVTLSNGNLTATHAVAAFRMVRGTVSKSTGKWYFEVTFNTLVSFGVVGLAPSTESLTNYPGGSASSWGAGNAASTNSYNNTSTSISVFTWASGDTIQVAWDADAGKLWFGRNNVWAGVSGVNTGFGSGVGDPESGSNARYTSVTGTLFPAANPGNGGTVTINSTMLYAPPSGFSVWG